MSTEFNTGLKLKIEGERLASELSDLNFDSILVEDYENMALAVAIGIALDKKGRNVNVVIKRQNEKDHGEKGIMIGELKGIILFLDRYLMNRISFIDEFKIGWHPCLDYPNWKIYR